MCHRRIEQTARLDELSLNMPYGYGKDRCGGNAQNQQIRVKLREVASPSYAEMMWNHAL